MQNASNAQHLKCPICNTIYGTLTGDMPPGEMKIKHIKKSCDSYNCGTIQINYRFPRGTQNGIQYSGTDRVAYLPNNEEGNKILQLLQISWERKLTFTIGTSVASGRTDAVIWNGVHHKTRMNGGATQFGYPDPGYFTRVAEELAAKGIL